MTEIFSSNLRARLALKAGSCPGIFKDTSFVRSASKAVSRRGAIH
jgi:hypothetical protein